MPGDLQRRLKRLEVAYGQHDEWADLRDPAYRDELARKGLRKMAALVWQSYVDANSAEVMQADFAERHPGWPDAYSEDARATMIWDDLVRGTPLQSQIYHALKDDLARRGIG